jgi:4-alpha-glucanotransferase
MTADIQPSEQGGLPRSAGILLHPTSLPGPHGVGDLGAAAYRFVDVLQAARQSIWQMMPLGPVGLGNSPYSARSAFAGAPLLVSLEEVAAKGWLDRGDLDGPDFPADTVQFWEAEQFKLDRLRRAFARFGQQASDDDTAAASTFLSQHAGWLDDFALFMALKDVHEQSSWLDWDRPLALREPDAIAKARRDLAEDVRFHAWVQWVFFDQWTAVRRYANERGITIVGDIPIFVALDSADVWVHRRLFKMDEHAKPTVVAGVPPDAFSATGQRWGNPVYDWDRMAEDGYRWWLDRFRATLELVDTVRLDHFRGFAAYWEVPAEEDTAINGTWVPGPGKALFDAVEAALGRVPMIVEDLGMITPDVDALREGLGFPGMKVLQFAFGDDAAKPIPKGTNPYLPHNYTPDCVVYTGTHDNNTSVGWLASLSDDERASVLRYLNTDGSRIAMDLIRLAHQSVAAVAVAPLQDLLELGEEGRMNLPGRPDHNWTWRFSEGMIDPWRVDWLAYLTAATARWKAPADESEPALTPQPPLPQAGEGE